MSLIAVIVGAAIAAAYGYENGHYVATADAAVVAPTMVVAAPAAGTVTAVDLPVGSVVAKGTVLAEVATPTGKVERVRALGVGRVAADYAHAGDTVMPGQELGVLAADAKSVVVANVTEANADRLRAGQRVDLQFPDDPSTVRGVVTAIGRAVIADQGQAGPPALTTANATQYVPVTIRFSKGGLRVVDGMSVTVRIHVG
jgi:multidrug resistance efflux pump